MPTSIQMESGNLLRVRISGVLREADLKEDQNAAEQEIARAGAVRLLFVLDRFEGWERGGAWDDVSFYGSHGQAIERIAIVGEEQWREEALAFAGQGLRKGEVRFFPPEELTRAEAWLAEQGRAPIPK